MSSEAQFSVCESNQLLSIPTAPWVELCAETRPQLGGRSELTVELLRNTTQPGSSCFLQPTAAWRGPPPAPLGVRKTVTFYF